MAGIRTLAISILHIINPENRIAQLDLFQDDFYELIKVLKNVNFL